MLLLFCSIKIIQFGLPYESRHIFFGKSIYCTYGLSNIIVTFLSFFAHPFFCHVVIVFAAQVILMHTILLWVFLEFDIIIVRKKVWKKGTQSKRRGRMKMYENAM